MTSVSSTGSTPGLTTTPTSSRTASPDPGILATREAVEALSGLEIQYYALVDMNGFRSLIDALGGLEITVMRRTPIGGGSSKILDWIEPGKQQLDGYHALWYARSREGSSNYERMARQRCVMSAMVDQVDPRTIALRFGDIAAASTGVLRTDIPQTELGTLAELAMKTRSQKITGVNFVPPLLKPWDYDIAEMHRIVEETIEISQDLPDERAVSDSARPLPGQTPTSSTDGSTSTPSPVGSPVASVLTMTRWIVPARTPSHGRTTSRRCVRSASRRRRRTPHGSAGVDCDTLRTVR